MKILIGTLYAIENEFDECIASIKRQSYSDFEHFVIKNLPNKEAHDTLYATFMNRSDEFDLFLKVDADMVIEDKDLFAKIVRKFRSNDWLKDLEIAVYDFFSDQLIWGMHAYRSNVEWKQNKEELFVDLCPVDGSERIADDSELAPAAIHCKNPSPFQSFHCGVHRALKVLQPGRNAVLKEYSRHHWENLERTRRNFLLKQDRRLGFAVLGAEMTFKEEILPCHLSYSNPYLRGLFNGYETLDSGQLKGEIRKISLKTFGFLPEQLRQKILRKWYR